MRIELEHGDPAVLRFRLLERHRPRNVRVPVLRERVTEAEALIQHFRDAGLVRH